MTVGKKNKTKATTLNRTRKIKYVKIWNFFNQHVYTKMQNIIAWENLTEAQGHGTVRTSDLGGAFFELSSWDCTAWERNAGVKRYVDGFLPSKSLERRSADGQRHASLIVTPVYHKDDWAAFSTALGGGRLLELRSHMTTAAFRWSRPVHRCHVIVQLFSFFFFYFTSETSAYQGQQETRSLFPSMTELLSE